MSDDQVAVLAAAEGVGAEIAWVVIYVLCWVLMIAPFALWWAGVRTPRAERRARREAARTADAEPAAADPHVTANTRERVAG